MSGNLKQILMSRPFSADSITQKKFLAEVETHTSGDVTTVNGVIML